MEVCISHSISSDWIGWDSSAWERDDLGDIAEDDSRQVQNKQRKVVFIHEVVDLWNFVPDNVMIINKSTWVTRENGQVLRRKILEKILITGH